MPHADSALVPPGLDQPAFWNHVHDQVQLLLDGQRDWITNLANASSLIYNSLLAYDAHFGSGPRAVNWCGFYIISQLFPSPQITRSRSDESRLVNSNRLLLGPFCGKPACQFINTTPGKARGVCADAFLKKSAVLVRDVGTYPGHIACDGETKSEVVCPLIVDVSGEQTVVGVLDLDCLAPGGFSEEDEHGLTRIARLVANACDW
ncbi:GAF domain-like protein [Laetiporus sulphureus 93-53]|uniref:GAF domain-like protein n=1 Tax=Laetiporus sulphureus 93-53 TaxID=1314785 RepID=A0A165GVY4_9APHY|nr:GAF domain-like protein [Laetiporus sulphureus 93-53]KZT10898.1 GAF domain-like protein [Laetiporus sulphureus 93-53]